MAKDPVVFALANQIPEISPEEAGPHVVVMATGRSDYLNEINKFLCYPGHFKGALDCLATHINEEMKIAAAYAIEYSAAVVKGARESKPERRRSQFE